MSFAAALAAGDKALRAALGGPVTYTPGAGAPVTVTGVFSAAYEHVDNGEAGMVSSGPAVFLTLADLPSDPAVDTGARVTVDGVVYRIREPKPDGQGAVVLLLHRA